MIATPSPAVSPSPAGPVAAGPPRLLDQVRAASRSRRYSTCTEGVFVGWIRRFILFHDKRHPAQLAEPEVVRFLSHLAVEDRVSPSAKRRPARPSSSSTATSSTGPSGRLDGVVRARRPIRRSQAAPDGARPTRRTPDGPARSP